MKIVIAVIIFSAIILFHELGHFLLAKKNHVVVKEFSLGMGPRLLSTVRGETRYSLKLLPIGGSCMMLGEDEDGDGQEHTVTYTPDVLTRYLLGFNRVNADSMEVGSMIEGMPLESSGIQVGDVITKINGTSVTESGAYDDYIEKNPLGDEPVTLTYERNGKSYETTVTPKQYDTVKMGFNYNLGCVKTSGLNVLKYSALEVKYWIRTTVHSIGMLIQGQFGIKDLTGPVGVVDVIGDTYEQTQSEGTLMVWMNMLNLAILLSANLGVMNLLPFPALDGGRLVFLLFEVIFRRPVNRQVEGMIHFAGLMLLMLLMVVVMYNDVMRIF